MSAPGPPREPRAAATGSPRRTAALLGGVAVAGVVLAVLSLVVVALVVDRLTGGDAPTADGPSAGASTLPLDRGDPWGVALGPVDAPHEVIVYEDLLSASSGDFFAAAGAELRSLAEAGSLRLIVRPLAYTTTYGTYSAQAASAVFAVRDVEGDEVAYAYNRALLSDVPAATGPFPSIDDLVATAVGVGAVEDDVREPIRADSGLDLVDLLTRRAIERDGVTSVPLVLLDREPFHEGAPTPALARRVVAAVS